MSTTTLERVVGENRVDEFGENVQWLMGEVSDRVIVFMVLTILALGQVALMSDLVDRTGGPTAGLDAAYAFVGILLTVYFAKPFVRFGWRERAGWAGKVVLVLALAGVGWAIVNSGGAVLEVMG